MSGELERRSGLIDVTYLQLHATLCGQEDGYTPKQLSELLLSRVDSFKNISNPFGKPSDASKKQVESGSVQLADGVTIAVDPESKPYIYAVSEAFQIDQIHAFVLLRSFLYNEGLPKDRGTNDDTSFTEELLEAITPFYYSERIHVLRTFLPLFTLLDNTAEANQDVAAEVLTEIIPDGPAFTRAILAEYNAKREAEVPEAIESSPHKASKWAKQNMKEQIGLLEVLFGAMFGFVACEGPLIVSLYETAYGSKLGSVQKNITHLLDAEGSQLLHDCSALWMVITTEVLELERIAQPGAIEVSTSPADEAIYTSSPKSLQRIHEIVTSHGDGQYACPYLGWTFVLSRLTVIVTEQGEIPDNYRTFFESLLPHLNRSNVKDREPTHVLMAKIVLSQGAGLLPLLHKLLTSSPLFVTAIALRDDSAVTDPNIVAYRSVMKGLVIALLELMPVEHIADFEALVDVWVALFGRSEVHSISGICKQYWTHDWVQGQARRALFDVARSRFPVEIRPLMKLLRSVSAAGFLDTDPIAPTNHAEMRLSLEQEEERDLCARHVFKYFDRLPSFTSIVPVTSLSGAWGLYEKLPERFGTANRAAGPVYVNVRTMKLPGGSILPNRSNARLLSSDGGDNLVLCWQHEHSGWKMILELLTGYVRRRQFSTGGSDIDFGQRSRSEVFSLSMELIGMSLASSPSEEQAAVTDALDLVRSVIQGNPPLAEELMITLEAGEPVVSHTMVEAQPPDLVQLTTMILEDALARPPRQTEGVSRLITSALSVLSSLLALPKYAHRVWLYVRSTTALFGSERVAGTSSHALAVERAAGRYTMTLALLHLSHALFWEAATSVLASKERLQQIKEEVLTRTLRFVHSQIWMEYMGWRYAQLSDKFEIGRRIAVLYHDVLNDSPLDVPDKPFATLSQGVADALLFQASASSISPLVSSISTGEALLKALFASRRLGDANRLISMLESKLQLVRLLLCIKLVSQPSVASLLEQALCARAAANGNSTVGRNVHDPIDVLASYVKERAAGPLVPVEAARVLSTLCSCFAMQQSGPTIIGHLADPEATATSFIRIVQHPYDDLNLRNTVWDFMAVAVDKEPAFANLLVIGQSRTRAHIKGKAKAPEQVDLDDSSAKLKSALDIAKEFVLSWRELWEANPQLLCSVLRFFVVVWRHGRAHQVILESIRKDTKFWDVLVSVAFEDLGAAPEYATKHFVTVEGRHRSDQYEAVSCYAYRTTVKSCVLRILAFDIELQLSSRAGGQAPDKCPSFTNLHHQLQNSAKLIDTVLEAAASAYDPAIYDDLNAEVKSRFPSLSLKLLRSQEPLSTREFSDEFVFSLSALRAKLEPYEVEGNATLSIAEDILQRLSSVNLNLALSQSQSALADAWQSVLRSIIPFERGDNSMRTTILAIAERLSEDISRESRTGDMMATLHGTRISLLLALLEVGWFTPDEKPQDVRHFVKLVDGARGIILNEAQPPEASLLGTLTVPFHGALLQVLYFCARQSRSLLQRPKVLNAEQRLQVSSMVEAVLAFIVSALRLCFDAAYGRLDMELDRNMELLVALFEQCTRPEVTPSSAQWLARCQETDVIRCSLDLLAKTDLVGLANPEVLLARRQPLYAPHILHFHMALASVPNAAERLASEGVLIAYSNNSLSSAISAGRIDVTIPELPGSRSPAHHAYCSMLAIITGTTSALGRHHHFFDAEASGFVQLYGDQISRALSWTIGDPLTFPLLEEIEQTIGLFYAIAESAPTGGNNMNGDDLAVSKVLRVFTSHALNLLQQLNYALTHPNHLASLFEAVTAEERSLVEKEPQTAPFRLIDAAARPLLTRIVYRLLKMVTLVLGALVSISHAETVLLGDREDWLSNEAHVVPHSKIVLGEPASIGTLLELANCSLDLLRDLSNRPAGQAIVPASASGKPNEPADVRSSVAVTRSALETTMLYTVTQLALWVAKPSSDVKEDTEFSESHGDTNTESRRALADRLQRGMTVEVSADVLRMVERSGPVIAKTNGTLGGRTADLSKVLATFLQDRVITFSS